LIGQPMRPGRVAWIGIRPLRRADIVPVDAAMLIAGQGVAGDHYKTARDGGRQVTLIAAEDLAAIASFLGRETVAPSLLRRNIVVAGVNLIALKDLRFTIGTAVLEGTGDCAPCSRMEEMLGPGGYNAVRGRGGICARIIEGGEVTVGDQVARVET
jgi:MOSC domain-containing protein YiiM